MIIKNAVHSFWSKPLLKADKDNIQSRAYGGYPSEFIFYCSWCYSALSILKYYPSLHLVTDNVGLKIFGPKGLNLPYHNINTQLNDINQYHEDLWTVGKLFTYQLQKEPFIHFDGDVFIYDEINPQLLTQPLFCQSKDIGFSFYKSFKKVLTSFNYVPDYLKKLDFLRLNSINAGIIGGTDIDFFEKYTREAFQFIDNNLDGFSEIDIGLFSPVCEQLLFSELAKTEQIPISFLFNNDMSEEYEEILQFQNAPFKEKYIHVVGLAKKKVVILDQIVLRLRNEFPEYFERVINFTKEKK